MTKIIGASEDENEDIEPIETKNLEEKEKGYNSKNYLYGILQDKIVTFDCKGYDKYGRLLGTIYLNGMNINDELLDKGFAVKYII